MSLTYWFCFARFKSYHCVICDVTIMQNVAATLGVALNTLCVLTQQPVNSRRNETQRRRPTPPREKHGRAALLMICRYRSLVGSSAGLTSCLRSADSPRITVTEVKWDGAAMLLSEQEAPENDQTNGGLDWFRSPGTRRHPQLTSVTVAVSLEDVQL